MNVGMTQAEIELRIRAARKIAKQMHIRVPNTRRPLTLDGSLFRLQMIEGMISAHRSHKV